MRVVVLSIAISSAACVGHVSTYGSSASAGHPPPLPPGASVPMWDHFCGSPSGLPDALIRLLDEASANGWELVGLGGDNPTSNLLCFKRPRVGTPTEPPRLTPPPLPLPPPLPQS